MSRLIKKIILIFGAVVFFLFLAFLGAAWYMGAFASVDIRTETIAPQHFIYLEQHGMYQKIATQLDNVHAYLQEKPVTLLHAAAEYLDDPNQTAPAEIRSRAGWLVSDSLEVQAPYHYQYLDSVYAVVARTRAHPVIAPFKTYPALRDWLERKQARSDSGRAVMEIYYASGIVEVIMPLVRTPQ